MQPTDTPSISPAPDTAFIINRTRIDELKKANGISSEAELARVIGVDAATLYRVSVREVVPSNRFMARVAAAFPLVSFDQLFILHARTSTRAAA